MNCRLLWIGCLIAAAPVSAAEPASSGVEVDDCAVRFAQEIDVPALESGALVELAVRQNQPVTRGETVARQDDVALLIRRRSAELQRAAAQEQLRDELELQYAQTARAEASAELEANRAVYDDARGAVPLVLLRRQRLAVERADLEVQRAVKAQRLAQIEIDLRSADLEVIEHQLRRLTIQSPLGGVVLQVYRQPGEWVSAGDPVVRVARLDQLHVHALASADRLPPHSADGQPVTVHWSNQGRRLALRGRVLSVDPEMLGGRRYRLHAQVDNVRDDQHWRLLPGTEVSMTVHPAVPRDAQSPDAGR